MCEMESLEAKLKWTYQPMKSQSENINERLKKHGIGVKRMAEGSLSSLGVCFDYKKYIQREGWQKNNNNNNKTDKAISGMRRYKKKW